MSSAIEVCNRCKLELPFNNSYEPIHVCPHCGADQNEKSENPFHAMKSLLPVAAAILFAMGMGVYWGSHSVEVIVIKSKQMTGLASAADHERMVEICEEQNKHECVHDSLVRKIKQNNDDIKTIAKLGQLQLQLGYFENSERTLTHYFEKGGKDIKARYNYAKALWKQGKIDPALNQLEKALNAKDGVLQVTVMETYIKLLVEYGQHQKATKVIAAVKRKGGSVDYLNSYVDRQLAANTR